MRWNLLLWLLRVDLKRLLLSKIIDGIRLAVFEHPRLNSKAANSYLEWIPPSARTASTIIGGSSQPSPFTHSSPDLNHWEFTMQQKGFEVLGGKMAPRPTLTPPNEYLHGHIPQSQTLVDRKRDRGHLCTRGSATGRTVSGRGMY